MCPTLKYVINSVCTCIATDALVLIRLQKKADLSLMDMKVDGTKEVRVDEN